MLKTQRWFPRKIFRALLTLEVVVPVLVRVAFFTLLERKILGLGQTRKGPNKVSIGGLLQPFADAVKLFRKEILGPTSANPLLFWWAPVTAIGLALRLWALLTGARGGLQVGSSVLLMLALMGLCLYPLLLAGWASNSKYAMVGAMRGVAQAISYEIRLALVLLALITPGASRRLEDWLRGTREFGALPAFAPALFVWVVACVAETNRTPFDFAEGESELVSGFNVEYGRGGFALIFMAEYARILFFSTIRACLLAGLSGLGGPRAVGGAALGSWWVWVRVTLPRYRYDKLMGLAWKRLLPLSLGVLRLHVRGGAWL